MRDQSFRDAVNYVRPFVMQVLTTDNRVGSGFVYSVLHDDQVDTILVATAYHCVKYAVQNQYPINVKFRDQYYVIQPQNVIYDEENDVASMWFYLRSGIVESIPELFPQNTVLAEGSNIGWVGYGSVTGGNEFSAYQGSISSVIGNSYYLDGSVVRGTSGGPAFILHPTKDEIIYVGVVVALRPALTTTLPQDQIEINSGFGVVKQLLDSHHRSLKAIKGSKDQADTPKEDTPKEDTPKEDTSKD